MRYNFLLGILVLALVGISSCTEDDDNNGGGPGGANCATRWALDTQDELTAMQNAATAYFNDITNTAKCSAYKDAAQDYLDAIGPYGTDCPGLIGQQRDDWQQEVDNVQASINSLPC